MITFSRRRFFQILIGAFAALGITRIFNWRFNSSPPGGEILGASHNFAHLIREKISLAPTSTESFDCCIVGGGISGLSAAWRLDKNKFHNFIVLELENQLGGNSSYGENEISKYPWGAHYLPFPNSESQLVRELLEELGAIEGYDEKGLPRYKDEYVCHSPEERLFIHGKWQDGIVPQLGLADEDLKQIERFHQIMERFKDQTGSDNKPAFAIPISYSSQDQEFLNLDQISMSDWMKRNNFSSPYLNWYVNYATRDDYGTEFNEVSAWAGIHYFAGRRGEASKHEANSILTWPEGNGWIVSKIREKIASKFRTNSLVYSITQDDHYAYIDYIELNSKSKKRIQCKKVIYAAPRFTTRYLLPELNNQEREYINSFEYAPWMVANITVKLPLQGSELGLYWDNVSYYSESLGYVYANHQDLTTRRDKGVITYYHPLSKRAPKDSREIALLKTHGEWCEEILSDLEHTHRDIRRQVIKIDIWIWGHAMIRPKVGFIWGEARRDINYQQGRVHFAHSDMSGISIFEEANFHGVRAADEVINQT